MNIAFTCKICHANGIAQCPNDTPLDWVKKFSPMLTCDRCYDLRGEWKAAANRIFRACETLNRMQGLGLDPDQIRARRGVCREALTEATKQYAAVLAKVNKLSAPVWMEDFVEQLIDAPQFAGQTLSRYRQLLSQLP